MDSFCCPLPSNNWPVNDLLVEFREFFPDDWDGIGQSVEGNLWEEVVFGLELHAAHQDHPKEVCVFVVSAGDHLVLDEWVADLFVVPVFLFVVSDQNKSWVKSCYQISDQEVQQVFVVVQNNAVMDDHTWQLNLN